MRKWRLLVVDDEPLNLEIIAEFLDDPGYDLDLVENPLRALEKLEAPDSKYDLIILDRMMPDMNGIELLRRIRAEERLCHIPVIMQTAASLPEQIREGIEAGAYYYLTKPYEPRVLLAIVHAALNDVEERSKWVSEEDRNKSRTDALRLLTRAEFSFSSLADAQHLVDLLASLCPAPTPAAIGLTELLVNAVEHGNLGISYAEKSRLRLEDGWEAEVLRRLDLPEYRGRVATVCMERDIGEIRFTIADQGKGFSWQNYLEMDPARAFDPNGRGIATARQISFSSIEYQGCGNVVLARLAIPGPQSTG
ncbi:MAG: response regulator [Proteobacteria bacterium]|nr:response regulator [Pseudomonadota bacterium]